MIISHKYRFIFIKTAKTAGTSIETYLSGFCGEEDVLTPVDPPEPGHRPRNGEGFYNHIGAGEIRAIVGDGIWSRYFKFCFERNPWDKVASMYFFWKKRFGSEASKFEDFVKLGQFPADYDKYSIDGRIEADFIGQHERLTEDFRRICQQLGIPASDRLPRAKSQYREGNRFPYAELYTEATRDIVAAAFEREIRYFGYRFGEPLDGRPEK
jgi:hypothetical protein